jgi:hypothetical protein
MYEIGIEEDISGLHAVSGDEIGFSFGKFIKGVGKAAKGVGKAAKSVVQSPITKAGVGVLAVAFPVVGIPAAAAVATANVAIAKVEAGKVAAKTLNKNLASLKLKAHAGDRNAATAVNAMQIALAHRKAARMGLARPVPVAQPGVSSFSTTPTPLPRAPTSLYAPTIKPAQLALRLAGGGSPVGKKLIDAVRAGKVVEVPSGVVVVAGKRPMRGKRVWIGKPPSGTRTVKVNGAHVVTKGGLVLTGQNVFQAA